MWHDVLPQSPPPPNKLVRVGKLSMMGNVVSSCPLHISLPALTIHNGTLAVTVTWSCHLVLHTSAQIQRWAAVLTNGDFTLSSKSAPQRRPLIGLALCHRRWSVWEEDGSPLKAHRCKQLLSFAGLYVIGILYMYFVAWRHFGSLTCSIPFEKNFPPLPLQPCGHVVIWFWNPSCYTEAPVTWASRVGLEVHTFFSVSRNDSGQTKDLKRCFRSICSCGWLNLSTFKSHTM